MGNYSVVTTRPFPRTSKRSFGAPAWMTFLTYFVVFLFLDSFRIQGNLSFPCFQTLSVFKGFCHFPVSRLFPYSKDFVIFLFPDSSVFKGFCHFPVSRVFLYWKDFVIFLFPDSFLIQGILSFPCFWLKTFKSKHLKGRMVPRVSTSRFFGSKEFCCFPCF